MLEFEKQKSIIDIANKTLPLPKKQKGLIAYQALIYNRFYEVLSHAFPIFFETINHDAFEKSIYEFMRYGAKTPYIWQVPGEYRKFVKAKRVFKNLLFIDDLLWFEWIEIKFFMQQYKKPKTVKFDFKNAYKLGISGVVKKLHYSVHKQDFQRQSDIYLLAYYDISKEGVFYREISGVMYFFLKNLNSHGLKKSIKILAGLSDESIKNVRKFLKPALQELCQLGILTIKKKRR